MRLLLVEDEASAMRRLVRLVGEHLGDRAQLVCVDDATKAIASLRETVFDGVLLDLNLGGRDGFDIMHAVGAIPCVVVSAHADRSLEAFDHAVLDFVPKPIVPARLAQALDRLSATGGGVRHASLVVRTTGRVEIIDCDRIASISGADDYAELVTIEGRRLLHDSGLAQLEQRLPPAFVRTHRSHIVNLQHVATIAGEGTHAITLVSGQVIPVSRRRLAEVRQRILRAKLDRTD